MRQVNVSQISYWQNKTFQQVKKKYFRLLIVMDSTCIYLTDRMLLVHIISIKNCTCKHMDLIKYGISIDLLNKMKDQYNMDNTFSSKQHLDFCNLRYPKTWLSNNSCWIQTLSFYCISNWLHIVWTKMHILSFKNQISRSCKINQ